MDDAHLKHFQQTADKLHMDGCIGPGFYSDICSVVLELTRLRDIEAIERAATQED